MPLLLTFKVPAQHIIYDAEKTFHKEQDLYKGKSTPSSGT
jgi:hypothetical protein